MNKHLQERCHKVAGYKLIYCPKCGKLVHPIFPLHDCKGKKLGKRTRITTPRKNLGSTTKVAAHVGLGGQLQRPTRTRLSLIPNPRQK